MSNDFLQKMALMWYVADINIHFDTFDDGIIRALAQELSEVSLRTPIWYKPEEYKKGTFEKIVEDIESKFLCAQPTNVCSITINGVVVKKKVSPLYLMGLLAWCVDRLSGGQVEDKEGFDYLKMGKILGKTEALNPQP